MSSTKFVVYGNLSPWELWNPLSKAAPGKYHSAQIIEYIMASWSYLFVCTLHYLIIIIMQPYLKVFKFKNACREHSVECVSKIKSILSVIFHAIYGTLCIQLTHLSYDDCENMCTLSCCHHQIGSMTYLPLLVGLRPALEGFVVTMHEGACETGSQIPTA